VSGTNGDEFKKLTFSGNSVSPSSPTVAVVPSGMGSFQISRIDCVNGQYLALSQGVGNSLVVYDAQSEAAVGSYSGSGIAYAGPLIPLKATNGKWYVVASNRDNTTTTKIAELPTGSFDHTGSLNWLTLFGGMNMVRGVSVGSPATAGGLSNVTFVVPAMSSGKASLKVYSGTVDDIVTAATAGMDTWTMAFEYVVQSWDGTSGPQSFGEAHVCRSGNNYLLAGFGTQSSVYKWMLLGVDRYGALLPTFNGGAELLKTTAPFDSYSARTAMALNCGTDGSNQMSFLYANGSVMGGSSTTSTEATIAE
jgi:hypothetical protein